jgi:hypothetical protein
MRSRVAAYTPILRSRSIARTCQQSPVATGRRTRTAIPQRARPPIRRCWTPTYRRVGARPQHPHGSSMAAPSGPLRAGRLRRLRDRTRRAPVVGQSRTAAVLGVWPVLNVRPDDDQPAPGRTAATSLVRNAPPVRTYSLPTTRPAGKPARSAGQQRPRHGLVGLRVARQSGATERGTKPFGRRGVSATLRRTAGLARCGHRLVAACKRFAAGPSAESERSREQARPGVWPGALWFAGDLGNVL